MFALVTQSDGSARRLTWMTYVIAALLIAGFVQFQETAEQAEERARLSVEVRAFFDEHPFVEVASAHNAIIPTDYARAMNEEYFAVRRSSGLPLLSPLRVMTTQDEFDELGLAWHEAVERHPAWRLGANNGSGAITNLFAHVGVHQTRYALIVSLIFLLLLALPLEGGWGALVFGPFCLLSAVLTAGVASAVGYTSSVGVPLVGASGLIAALAGATLHRSLKNSPLLLGRVPLPGWLLVPVWLGFEYLGVRDALSGGPPIAPLIVHAAGFGFGLATSAGLLALKFEEKQLRKAHGTHEAAPNVVLERALKARDEGREAIAFEMLQREHERVSENLAVAQEMWDLAVVLGRESEAIGAALLTIQGRLRASNTGQAVNLWFAVQDVGGAAQADPHLQVRIAEAMIAEGHASGAVDLLRGVLEGGEGVSTVMAQRIVAIARDLDPELTGRAARLALEDEHLSQNDRDQLSRLSEEVQMSRPAKAELAEAPPAPEPEPAPEDSQEEFGSVALAEDHEMLELDGSFTKRDEWDGSEGSVDPNALDLSKAEGAAGKSGSTPAIPDSELGLEDPPGDTHDELSLSDLGMDDASENASEDASSELAGLGLSVSDQATDCFDSPEEIRDLSADLADDFDEIDHTELEHTIKDTGLTDIISGLTSDAAPPTAVELGSETVTEVSVSSSDNDATVLAEMHDTATPPLPRATGLASLREIRVREGVPLRLESGAISIEIDGSGKTRLEFGRIEGLAVAAVHGITAKPVVVIDLVLNWQTAGEPLKLIRLRSDRFDPRQLVPGSSAPLEGLSAMLREILAGSGAEALPSREAATGESFSSFADLASYQREVLRGTS